MVKSSTGTDITMFSSVSHICVWTSVIINTKVAKSRNILTVEMNFQSFLLQRNLALAGATKIMANLLWLLMLVRRLRSIVRPRIFSLFSVKWATNMVTYTGEHPLMFCVSILLTVIMQHSMGRDHFVYAPSQWETTLQRNVVSHWLGAYTKWSLYESCKYNKMSYFAKGSSVRLRCWSLNIVFNSLHPIWRSSDGVWVGSSDLTNIVRYSETCL